MSFCKRRIENLALAGGAPLFAEPLHVGQINLPPQDKFVKAMQGIFQREFYTNHGPLVRKLDRKLADFLGARHAVCMTNGTIALMLAAKALDLSGEVILPSFTFVATAQAMTWAGLTPVFCDVAPDTHNLDPQRVEALINERTSAILGVHLWGRACEVEALQSLADRHSIKLFFDASHAFACSHDGKMIGNCGQLEVFSLHATKICNTLEGGFVATNNDALADRLRTVRSFHSSQTLTKAPMRINGKMSEAQAAMGLLNLDEMPGYLKNNKIRYEAYREGVADIPGLRIIPYSGQEKNNFQFIVIQVDAGKAGLARDQFVRILEAENVLARRYFTPGIHHMPPYSEQYPQYADALPVTDRLCEELLQLPSGQNISLSQIALVCDLIRFAQNNAGDLNSKKNRKYMAPADPPSHGHRVRP